MIPLPLDDVRRVPGRLDTAPWADDVTGVQVDSRRIEENDLFVAVGDGAAFVKHAFARGAAATLVPDDAFAAYKEAKGFEPKYRPALDALAAAYAAKGDWAAWVAERRALAEIAEAEEKPALEEEIGLEDVERVLNEQPGVIDSAAVARPGPGSPPPCSPPRAR